MRASDWMAPLAVEGNADADEEFGYDMPHGPSLRRAPTAGRMSKLGGGGGTQFFCVPHPAFCGSQCLASCVLPLGTVWSQRALFRIDSVNVRTRLVRLLLQGSFGERRFKASCEPRLRGTRRNPPR